MDDLNVYEYVKEHKYEFKNGIPLLKKDNFDGVDWNNIKVINHTHRKKIEDPTNVCFEFFNNDKVLENVWRNSRIGFITYDWSFATATPDFSLRENMSLIDIVRNIYRSRLIGCFWQLFGIRIIQTMQWCGKDTYDLSFNTLEEGTPVIISTKRFQLLVL